VGWGDLENAGRDVGKEGQAKQEQTALRAQVHKALGEPNSPMQRYLEAVVRGQSYAPGRTPEDVAYAEGQRSMARQLLKLGGVYDG